MRFRARRGCKKGAVVTVFRVPPESSGQRLDVFVQHELRRTSRTRHAADHQAVGLRRERAAPQVQRPGARLPARAALARGLGRGAGADRDPRALRGRALPRGGQAAEPAGAPVGALPQEHAHQPAEGGAAGHVPVAGAPARSRDLGGDHGRQDRRGRPRAQAAVRAARRRGEDLLRAHLGPPATRRARRARRGGRELPLRVPRRARPGQPAPGEDAPRGRTRLAPLGDPLHGARDQGARGTHLRAGDLRPRDRAAAPDPAAPGGAGHAHRRR